MDSQELYDLQEAYLEIYQKLDDTQEVYEAKVDDTMSDWQKLNARDERHIDRLSPRHRIELDMSVRSGDTSVNQHRQKAHKERRGKKGKPIARSIRGSGHYGKYYRASIEKKEAKMSPEDIKNKKRKDMLRRMNNAAERHGLSDHYDLYDIILSHLLDEGYAETPEAAEKIMVNMSEEWRNSIIG